MLSSTIAIRTDLHLLNRLGFRSAFTRLLCELCVLGGADLTSCIGTFFSVTSVSLWYQFFSTFPIFLPVSIWCRSFSTGERHEPRLIFTVACPPTWGGGTSRRVLPVKRRLTDRAVSRLNPRSESICSNGSPKNKKSAGTDVSITCSTCVHRIRFNDFCEMPHINIEVQLARPGCLGSNWRQPVSPQRGRSGSGGAARRAPTQPPPLACYPILNRPTRTHHRSGPNRSDGSARELCDPLPASH